MDNTERVIIENPSRKLEETMRKIGARKYLWLEELCSNKTQPTHIIGGSKTRTANPL